ncbi:MAG TPA: response regulator, partial [Chthoniobacteraceae bacterium]
MASSLNHRTGPLRVLLVEDNPGDVFLITEMLSDAPRRLEIESVGLLADALRRLDAGGIDVVVSDLSLPDSRGLETFEKLHSHASRTPIIILSGFDDERMALRTVELGAQDYLVKGQVDQALLVRSIQYSITRAELDSALENERNLLRSAILELKERNAEIEDDLNLAREVQQAFLPQQFPSFPKD